MQAAAECTSNCGNAEPHYGPRTRQRRRGEHPFAYRQHALLVGLDAPVQTTHPTTRHAIQDSTTHPTTCHAIQDSHCRRELSKDETQTDCELVRKTVAAALARRWHGNEGLCLTGSWRRRHSETGGLLRTTNMQKKVATLSFGILMCWWSNFTGSINAAVGATVPVRFGGGCPSACSGHGYCTNPRTETCSCHQGWAGGDCSIRKWCGILY